MEVADGISADIDYWLNLANNVSWNFLELETQERIKIKAKIIA